LKDRADFVQLPTTDAAGDRIACQNYVHDYRIEADRKNSRLGQLEAHITEMARDEKVIDELTSWTTELWTQLMNHFSMGQKSLDVIEITAALLTHNALENLEISEKHCVPLHLPEYPESNCGLIVQFKSDSNMAPNSSLKFFSDPFCQDQIYELNAGKRGRTAIPPIILKQGRVWICYSCFVDTSLPPGLQVSFGPSVVKCRVFAVPSSWTTAVWLTDVLPAVIPSDKTVFLHKLISSITEFLTFSRSPTPIRQIIFKILTRIVRRLRYNSSLAPGGKTEDHFDALGIKQDWFICLMEEVKMWKDEHPSVSLLSTYLQDAAELVATCLLPWDYRA
jgi:hypothetical protein